MKHALSLGIMALAGSVASAALAEQYDMDYTLQLDAELSEVWNYAGDFCDIDDWHPMITACTLKVIDGSLHRILTLANGAEVVEKRVAVEPGLSYTYKIISAPVPIERYTATFSVAAGKGTQVRWSGRFKSDDPEMEALFADIYVKGLEAIEAHFTE